ncbi:MAG: hypothetical protein AB7P53_02460 [Candidatus Dadabacteria bacterium]
MPRRNIRRIPPMLIEKISSFEMDDVVVACVKFLRSEDLPRYSHLGLKLENGKLLIPSSKIPDPSAGRYSKANVYGYEKTRRDLPKIWKSYDMEVPNWGDWANGSHTITFLREVYPKDFYPPKEVELSIALIEERAGGFVIGFTIDQVLNRSTKNFEQDLFYNLNLLQENAGAIDVFTSTASLAEYTSNIIVDWQIFPPSTADEVVKRMLRGKSRISDEQKAIMKSRISVMSTLNPEAYVTGTDGFLRYFGAKFGEDFVAFENIHYGNALYIMYESWEQLSKKSRVELLNGPRDSFDRIEHRDGWIPKFIKIVQKYRSNRKSPE